MDQQKDRWELIGSRVLADCRVFEVLEKEFSRRGDSDIFYQLDCPDWSNIVALTPENDVVLIEQFRFGVEKDVLEIPGGLINKGEEPLVAAERELREETGYTSSRIAAIGSSYPNPAIQGNRIFHFLALDCVKTEDTDLDEHESIVTRLVPFRHVEELVQNGEITHSLAITAIYYAEKYLRNEGFIN